VRVLELGRKERFRGCDRQHEAGARGHDDGGRRFGVAYSGARHDCGDEVGTDAWERNEVIESIDGHERPAPVTARYASHTAERSREPTRERRRA
jgi:hypothetical protein